MPLWRSPPVSPSSSDSDSSPTPPPLPYRTVSVTQRPPYPINSDTQPQPTTTTITPLQPPGPSPRPPLSQLILPRPPTLPSPSSPPSSTDFSPVSPVLPSSSGPFPLLPYRTATFTQRPPYPITSNTQSQPTPTSTPPSQPSAPSPPSPSMPTTPVVPGSPGSPSPPVSPASTHLSSGPPSPSTTSPSLIRRRRDRADNLPPHPATTYLLTLPPYTPPPHNSSSEELCPVCLDTLSPTDNASLLPCCNTPFHFPCLHDWLTTPLANARCPHCRHQLYEIPSPPLWTSNLRTQPHDWNSRSRISELTLELERRDGGERTQAWRTSLTIPELTRQMESRQRAEGWMDPAVFEASLGDTIRGAGARARGPTPAPYPTTREQNPAPTQPPTPPVQSRPYQGTLSWASRFPPPTISEPSSQPELREGVEGWSTPGEFHASLRDRITSPTAAGPDPTTAPTPAAGTQGLTQSPELSQDTQDFESWRRRMMEPPRQRTVLDVATQVESRGGPEGWLTPEEFRASLRNGVPIATTPAPVPDPQTQNPAHTHPQPFIPLPYPPTSQGTQSRPSTIQPHPRNQPTAPTPEPHPQLETTQGTEGYRTWRSPIDNQEYVSMITSNAMPTTGSMSRERGSTSRPSQAQVQARIREARPSGGYPRPAIPTPLARSNLNLLRQATGLAAVGYSVGVGDGDRGGRTMTREEDDGGHDHEDDDELDTVL